MHSISTYTCRTCGWCTRTLLKGCYCIKLFYFENYKNSYFITDRVRKKYCYLCEDLVPKLYWTNGSHRLSCQRQRLHKQFLDNLPTPYASITCPDCSEVLISYSIFHIIQGVRKWNVFFESAPVAKLLIILTGSDVF